MSFKERITNNIGWKIAGICLALFLWFHLATDKVYEKSIEAAVVTSGLEDGLEIESVVPENISIVMVGTGKQLIKQSLSGDITVRADLSYIKAPGQYEHIFDILDIYPVEPHFYSDLSFSTTDRCVVIIKNKI